MSGVVRRPVHSNPIEGRAATIVVLVVILALLAGCGGAAPSSGATASAAPGTTGTPTASGAPGGPTGPGSTPSIPGGTPEPSAEPAGAWVRGVQLPPARAVASLEPTREARAGVLSDTAFRLRALDGSDPVDLASHLVADPALDLRVSRQGDAAIVKPAAPLADGQRYRLSLMATDGSVRATWAVQAVAPLKVSSTTPGDQSTDVPLRTGIEVAFNQHGVDLADAQRFIRIQPAVTGHFEQEGRTIAFVPDRPLEPATVYTVTVRQGLPLAGTDEALAADDVSQFETASSTAAQPYFWVATNLMEIRPTELATIPAGYERHEDEDEDPEAGQAPEPAIPDHVAVTVHRLDDMPKAVDAWRSLEELPSWAVHGTDPGVPTDGLRVAWEGTLPIEALAMGGGGEDEEDEGDVTTAVRLPVALDPGWYVVTFRPEGRPRQLVLQVTDLAVYTLVTTTRSAAWVNDLATGRPVKAATATLDGSRLGTTDADGVVTGPTPRRVTAGTPGEAERAASVVEVRAGGRGVFVPAAESACEKCADEQVDQPWLLVFQSDRWEYRPTDTIGAWGMARRRSSGSIPASVQLRLATWSDTVAEGMVLETRDVTPDRNGVFAARIPVTDLPYGEYRLQLWINGNLVSDRGISVAVIEKPAWTLRVGTSHRAVVDGGTVRATATATFFEGTPVAGVQLKLGSGTGSNVTTGLAGTASRPVTLRFEGDEEWEEWGESEQWAIQEIEAYPRLPEEAEMYAGAMVAVFRAGVILRSDAVVVDDRVVVSGTVHDVALARFDRSDERWFDGVDPYGRVRAGQQVRVRTIEHIYRTTQTGTTYDWVLKQTVPAYVTTETTRDLGTRTVRSDADGRFRVTFPTAGRDRSYEVRVRTTDPQGRQTLEQHWASTPEMTFEDGDPRIETDAPDDGVSVGGTVRLRFTGGLTGGSGARYLWLRSRDGLQATAVTSRPRYAFTFRGSDVPNVVVHAVRFNGHGYEPASWEAWVPFRVADRELRISVTPDHRRYEPGDRASLAIRTLDTSGRPVSASVYLGVLDEKLVSMGLVALENPLGSLYESVGSGVIGLSWTHRGLTGGATGGDATGGGGGSDAPRTDFRDWLVARIVRTDANGVARVSFDLSDDLTSWHAFAIGIGRALRAGEGEAVLPVSLPLFADVTLAESYLVADRPIVRLRAFGTALDASDTVTYRVSSSSLEMTPVTVTARALVAASVTLPPLTAGTHRLRIEARTGSGDRARHDTLVRSFEVVASRVTQSTLTSASLDGPMAVPAGEGLTSLVLADAGRGRVLPLLERLADGTGSVRGDQALAAGIAERALRDGFGIEPWRGAIDADVDPWLDDEGFSVMTYGGGELELSALAALSGDPRVGTLRDYFGWAEATTREEQIWLLAGRAALGDAVLPDIRTLAAEELTVPERVALANAALAAGDEDLAGRLLRDTLATAGEQRGRWVRLTGGRTADEPIVLTARLAIVAASLGEPVAIQMDAYLDENTPRRTVVDLERALAAQGWVGRMPAASAVAVLAVGSRRSELRIEDSEAVSVQLTPSQAAKARLRPVSGSVVVSVRVDRPLDAATLRAPAWLAPARTVRPSGQIGIADTVIVLIKLRRPPDDASGCLVVRDVAPSGLVPIMGSGYSDDEDEDEVPSTAGPDRIVGQAVEFCVGADDTPGAQVTLRYAARVISPGRYLWEPTLLQLSDTPEVGTVVPATRIVISANE